MCNQEETFFDYLLGKEITEGEETQPSTEGPQCLESTFEFLASSDLINETAAGYLLKLLTQISYQRGEYVTSD